MSSLVPLVHNRWSLAVVAELHRSGGAKFVTLAHRLGVGRESLKRTLATLAALDVVAKNPGYGHPLRPEYVLTPRGRRIAPACAELLAALAERGLEDVGLRKWSLPVLVALDGGRRFSELRAALPGATSRALALALKDLGAAGLVRRELVDEFPPTALYRATSEARALRRLAERLARAA